MPTIFENYISRIEIGKKTVDMSLWDTAGQVRSIALAILSADS